MNAKTGNMRGKSFLARDIFQKPIQKGPLLTARLELLAHHAEAALASLVIGHCVVQLFAAKLGPETPADEDLGVGKLPEEEIADPELSAGADEEIGIGHVFRREVLRDEMFIDLFGRDRALLDPHCDLSDRSREIPAAAVAEGEAKMEA